MSTMRMVFPILCGPFVRQLDENREPLPACERSALLGGSSHVRAGPDGWQPPQVHADRPRAVSAIHSGGDVVVEVKDVVGVVAALDVAESLVVGAVGGPDDVVALVVAEVVEPATGGEVRPQRGERLASPADV